MQNRYREQPTDEQFGEHVRKDSARAAKAGLMWRNPMRLVSITLAACALSAAAFAQTQRIDEGYTAKIHQYTTEPYFLTELVDHLPASDTVPTPERFLATPSVRRTSSRTPRTSIATCAR